MPYFNLAVTFNARLLFIPVKSLSVLTPKIFHVKLH